MSVADYDVIVIGAGMAGINATATAIGSGARVALVERDRIGGTCPVRGCIPSKTLIRSAEVAHLARRAPEFGIEVGEVRVDYPKVIERVQSIVDRGSNGARGYLESLEALDIVYGEARMAGPNEVAVNGDLLRAPKVVLATGSEPASAPIEGLADIGYWTSDDVLKRPELPDRLIVIGAGPIGLELGQALGRLGSTVTVVEVLPAILPMADFEVGELLVESLEGEGVEMMLGATVRRAEAGPDGSKRLVVDHGGETKTVEADVILLGAGRVPAVGALDLAAAGVEYTPKGIGVDSRLATSGPGVYAAGDVLGAPYGPFTHVARRLGREVVENALDLAPHDVDVDWGPHAIFTDPNVVMVGVSETDARAAGHDVKVGTSSFSGGRARAMGEERGFAKVVTDATSSRILGAQIIGHHAADLIHPIAVAMNAGDGSVEPIFRTMHVHPTLGEVVKSAADGAR